MPKELLAPDPASERPPGWAVEAGKSLERAALLGNGPKIAPPTLPDRAYDDDGEVPVRRVVYRVSIAVPDAVRAAHPPVLPSPAELHLDVGVDRLRARFQGAAWPVDEGSEVRLRVDVPGVYLFDASGGRPIAPGHLGSWFAGDEGQAAPRVPPTIRRDPGPILEGPAELICALIAEWTNHPRHALTPQCSGGAIPLSFRFGIWAADITAIVPMTMHRFQLRADAADAPRPIPSARVRSLLSARDIERLQPLARRFTQGLPEVDAGAQVPGMLRVANRSRERTLIVVQGLPLAWLQPGAAADLAGFTPGYYRVAALGAAATRAHTPAPLWLPGELDLGASSEAP